MSTAPVQDPAAAPAADVSVVNAANGITLLRLLLVPLFVVLLLHSAGTATAWRVAAFAVFVTASATDRLDGHLARTRGLVTDVGKVADPIADKALIGTALTGLSVLGELPWWITVVVLTRELLITVLRFLVIRHGVIPASRGGKVKTFLQALAIGLYVLPLPAGGPHTFRYAVMLVAVAVTVGTGVDYAVRAWRDHGIRAAAARP